MAGKEFFLIDFTVSVFSDFNPVECSASSSCNCSTRLEGYSAYTTGESVNDFHGRGHALTLFIWIATALISLLAIAGNLLIITIHWMRRKTLSSFEFSLSWLALFDLWTSLGSIFGSTGFILMTWRGSYTIHFFLWGTCMSYSGYYLSAFMTLIISVERFIAITFPLKAKSWLTPKAAKWLGFCVVPWVSLLFFMRFLIPTFSVVPNTCEDIQGLKGFPYLVIRTKFGAHYYENQQRLVIDLLTIYIPFPLLLLVTFGSWWNVKKLSSWREQLNKRRMKEINGVQMFIPVVLCYLFSQGYCCSYANMIRWKGYAYREGFLGMFLVVVVAAAANLPIYYWKGSGFKKQVKSFLSR